MTTPYQILNVQPSASDAEIKQAYLQQLKLFPPDKDPQQFQLIHQAYIKVKDIKSRLSYELFNVAEVNFAQMIDKALTIKGKTELTATQFNTLFQASVDHVTFQTSLSNIEK